MDRRESGERKAESGKSVGSGFFVSFIGSGFSYAGNHNGDDLVRFLGEFFQQFGLHEFPLSDLRFPP
tara:strand:+ start:366 stop:566 length:201 start_codon:yes stop_codon:yes gene_type:complete